MRWKAAWTVTRDILCFLMGGFGLLHQELTGRTQWELLVVYTTLLGFPGVAGAISLGRGKLIPPAGNGTPVSSSSSQSSSE